MEKKGIEIIDLPKPDVFADASNDEVRWSTRLANVSVRHDYVTTSCSDLEAIRTFAGALLAATKVAAQYEKPEPQLRNCSRADCDGKTTNWMGLCHACLAEFEEWRLAGVRKR